VVEEWMKSINIPNKSRNSYTFYNFFSSGCLSTTPEKHRLWGRNLVVWLVWGSTPSHGEREEKQYMRQCNLLCGVFRAFRLVELKKQEANLEISDEIIVEV